MEVYAGHCVLSKSNDERNNSLWIMVCFYKEIMFNTISNIARGERISASFKDQWCVPDVAYYMIQTGESTGELAEMLDKVADYYQKEQKNTVGSIKTYIEPIMIIGLAVVVGFILVAILVPMFDVYNTVQ